MDKQPISSTEFSVDVISGCFRSRCAPLEEILVKGPEGLKVLLQSEGQASQAAEGRWYRATGEYHPTGEGEDSDSHFDGLILAHGFGTSSVVSSLTTSLGVRSRPGNASVLTQLRTKSQLPVRYPRGSTRKSQKYPEEYPALSGIGRIH